MHDPPTGDFPLMSLEVELKFRTEGRGADDLIRRLESMGAEAAQLIEQEDVYYSHPARDFASSGEALRLRREGQSNWLTYKGPRLEGPTKSREEIEIGFTDGIETQDQMRRLWERLG